MRIFKRKHSPQIDLQSPNGGNASVVKKASDLPIALYLNQRLTFDILATLENGFSYVRRVETSSAAENSSEISGNASIGISNAFALLGVQFGAQGNRLQGVSQSESASAEFVHTPASLFARLRKELHERSIVNEFSTTGGLERVKIGDFVEFEATLRRNPFLSALESFSGLMPLVAAMEPKNRSKPSRNSSETQVPPQVNSILEALNTGQSQDLTAKIGETGIVITAEQQYFADPTLNDVIDGTFRVFGKVSRVIQEGDDDSINLLRKSTLGRLKAIEPHLSSLMETLQGLGMDGQTSSEIRGPSMQVIPIAIFA